jgi:hypothetical protein
MHNEVAGFLQACGGKAGILMTAASSFLAAGFRRHHPWRGAGHAVMAQEAKMAAVEMSALKFALAVMFKI